MGKKTKLRAYVIFKQIFPTEHYILQTLSKSGRSLMTQLRFKILPLEIKTERFTPIYDKALNRKGEPLQIKIKIL